ncbi:nitrate ABC transporter substrate-binding protein [Bosea sp. NBC_00550]|uniref:nitrate ABC transporter substrate-binding protein n=1 Tax=Bosea sp. NBC_00550 TaxID=2969621 RepID=UPI00223084A5|nr:nitrate ABC transporter substrate-binding protein [Bosea sp. NBC_00550]UZF92972.1 nitrate ABC transporter substrate-binding protein [Bosea sp. NBC_00550]
MKPVIRLALRDWDFITPLLLGDLVPEKFELKIERLAALPDDFASDPRFDASEISFSRYTTGKARGETGVFGIPNFIMRGFRHRCVVTTAASPLKRFEDLRGKRIGIAGWQDSGNTWTRAALAESGVGIEDAFWAVSRLGADHPITDRVGRYARPGRIEPLPGQPPLLDLLTAGEIDAVLMPFMPKGFFSPGSPFRALLPDIRAAEKGYFDKVGYVPGMHIIGLKPEIVARDPWLPQALSDLLDESQRVWLEKRRRYADTTPWLIDELVRSGHDLPADWNASGLGPNRVMIAAFLDQLRIQELAETDLTPETLFPAAGELAEPARVA